MFMHAPALANAAQCLHGSLAGILSYRSYSIRWIWFLLDWIWDFVGWLPVSDRGGLVQGGLLQIHFYHPLPVLNQF